MKLIRRARDSVKRFEVLLYFLTAILGLFLAAGAIFRAAKYPSESVWLPGKPLFWGLVVSAVWVPIYALYKAIDAHLETRDRVQSGAERDLAIACQKVVSEVADACGNVGVNDLHTAVWLCCDDGSFKELARFYLPHDLKASGVVWRKGKGVAGIAWEADSDLDSDLTVLLAQWASIGDEAFDALPASERLGLQSSDLAKTRGDTGVCAIPLRVEGTLIAMFVLVYAGADGFDCVRREVGRRGISNILAGCEGVLEQADGALR
jgi:hypothetical protein